MPPQRTHKQKTQPTRQHVQSSNPSASRDPNSANRGGTRRGMDLESMLNPSDEVQAPSASPSASPSLSSASMEIDDDQNLQAIPTPDHSTHFSRSRKNSRRQNLTPTASTDGEGSPPSHENVVPARSRNFRPPYLKEHYLFIWFHRVDLNWPWDKVWAAFCRTFNEERRDKDGLQCKYYRVRAQHGIPKVRDSLGKSSQNGMWATTGRRYPWMEAYAAILPGMVIVKALLARTNVC